VLDVVERVLQSSTSSLTTREYAINAVMKLSTRSDWSTVEKSIYFFYSRTLWLRIPWDVRAFVSLKLAEQLVNVKSFCCVTMIWAKFAY